MEFKLTPIGSCLAQSCDRRLHSKKNKGKGLNTDDSTQSEDSLKLKRS